LILKPKKISSSIAYSETEKVFHRKKKKNKLFKVPHHKTKLKITCLGTVPQTVKFVVSLLRPKRENIKVVHHQYPVSVTRKNYTVFNLSSETSLVLQTFFIT